MSAVIVDRDVVLDDLPGVDLATISEQASLQTRADAKYVVDADVLRRLLWIVRGDAMVLAIDDRRAFRYGSTYFDTPELDSYLGTARRRPNRFKVRTRTYLDDGTSWIEVKQRDRRGRTVKHRVGLDDPLAGVDVVALGDLGGSARRFVDELVPGVADRLVPVLTTSYVRSTLLVGTARITIDRAVRCTTCDGRTAVVDGLVVETKHERPGGPVDRHLWSLGARPVKISKFATGLATLRPELPSNRWHRVIARHLAVLEPC